MIAGRKGGQAKHDGTTAKGGFSEHIADGNRKSLVIPDSRREW